MPRGVSWGRKEAVWLRGRAAQLRPAARTCLTSTPGSGHAASTTSGAAPGADPPRFTQRPGGRTATGIASPVPAALRCTAAPAPVPVPARGGPAGPGWGGRGGAGPLLPAPGPAGARGGGAEPSRAAPWLLASPRRRGALCRRAALCAPLFSFILFLFFSLLTLA